MVQSKVTASCTNANPRLLIACLLSRDETTTPQRSHFPCLSWPNLLCQRRNKCTCTLEHAKLTSTACPTAQFPSRSADCRLHGRGRRGAVGGRQTEGEMSRSIGITTEWARTRCVCVASVCCTYLIVVCPLNVRTRTYSIATCVSGERVRKRGEEGEKAARP